MHNELDNIESKSEQELAERLTSLRADIYLMSREAKYIEQELSARLDARDGRVIRVTRPNPIDNYTLERSFSPAYIQNRFTALKELLDPKDLDVVFVGEHYLKPEPQFIPDTWLTSKLKKLANDYGGEVKKIVENAKANSMIATARFRIKHEGESEDDDETESK